LVSKDIVSFEEERVDEVEGVCGRALYSLEDGRLVGAKVAEAFNLYLFITDQKVIYLI
jgi:hypothetical protein